MIPRIAFVAPSGQVLDPAALDRAAAHLTRRGFRVEADDAVFAQHQRFAGPDALRAEALVNAAQSGAHIVLAVRGGYGISRLLTQIDWPTLGNAVHERGVMFVGHSDFTALQLGLLATTGAPSFAGPMACYDFGAETISDFTQHHFDAMLGQAKHAVDLNLRGDAGQASIDVSGVLWGGNLAMVCSLIGSPWWPEIDGGLLFLEDINEHPFRVERMLLQLLHAGVLERQRAVLLGDFSGYRLGDHDQGYDIDAAIAELRRRLAALGIPVLTGLPFGHCRDKLTLPVGAVCRLEARSEAHSSEPFRLHLSNPLRA